MKIKFILTLLIVNISMFAIAQNPYKYESKIVIISVDAGEDWILVYGDPFPNGAIRISNQNRNVIQPAFNDVCKYYNDRGFRAVTVTTLSNPPQYHNNKLVGRFQYQYIFEKSDSYREAELYKLINELTTRIDTTSQNYIKAAKIDINTDVLKYLKTTTEGLLKEEYQEELRKMIDLALDEKLKKLKEEIIKDIRNSSSAIN